MKRTLFWTSGIVGGAAILAFYRFAWLNPGRSEVNGLIGAGALVFGALAALVLAGLAAILSK